METNVNPRFMLVLFLQLFLKSHICLGADKISAKQSLSGDQTIVSARGKFELGFFAPGKSPYFYIGMWYKEIPEQTIVWVANREKPVSNRFLSELKISNGNLVLFNESNIPIWSTNVKNSNSSSVQAILLDNGNLVLNDGSNSSEPLWQSFDNPSHTFLPGGKVSYNKVTKTHKPLTSWKNSEDPSSGLFTIRLNESDNSYVMLWNGTRPYWNSGPWNGQRFSLMPEMRQDYIYNFSFVSNENETYFTYSVKNISMVISRILLEVSGQLTQQNYLSDNRWSLFWSEPNQCEVYALCGLYGSCNESSLPFCNCLTGFVPKSQSEWDLADYSGGCVRRTELQCGKNSLPHGDRFLEMPSMSLPENKQSLQVGSITECESNCLNDCSCTAYAYDNISCSIWREDLLNLKQLSAGNSSRPTLHIRLAASEFPNNSEGSPRSRKFYILLFGIIAAAVVTSVISCSVYLLRRKKVANKRGKKRNTQGNQEVSINKSERNITDFMLISGQSREEESKVINVPFVALESILVATDNFSEANKLGRGGFGPVYKGKFPGGLEIAIKRLSSCSRQGLQEFMNEVLLIAKLQHRNLVRLLGYCVEGEEKMLLYEFMPNKSLDSFIFDCKLCVLLNWEIRFNIILGIARGLLYLHHDSRLRIIHRDLKTSNVLLDEEMNPKVSDFGLARIFGGKQIEASTNRVVGTYGYMSPEYAIHGLFSIKSDVFSFGVVILEIISGKRNTGFYQSEQALSLLDYAWKLWKENKALDLMDATLIETCDENEFLRCFKVGLLCVQDDPSDRPTMSSVVFMLGNEAGTLPSPKQPAFVVKRTLSRGTSSSKPLSNNALTNTLNEGR